MNQGIEIILARMESHPQEFDGGGSFGPYGEWTYIIEQVLNIGGSASFTKEERDALSIKLREMARERFTNQVLKKLLDGPEAHKTQGTDTARNKYKYASPSFAKERNK